MMYVHVQSIRGVVRAWIRRKLSEASGCGYSAGFFENRNLSHSMLHGSMEGVCRGHEVFGEGSGIVFRSRSPKYGSAVLQGRSHWV